MTDAPGRTVAPRISEEVEVLQLDVVCVSVSDMAALPGLLS